MGEKRTDIHRVLNELIYEFYTAQGVGFITEYEVTQGPLKVDLVLDKGETGIWTEKQLKFLPDGIRDCNAQRILIEFKSTESMGEDNLLQVSTYRRYARLKTKGSMASFLVVSRTPQKERLKKYGFKRKHRHGIYCTGENFIRGIGLIVLNELEDTSYNALFKLFASRKAEKEKAMAHLADPLVYERMALLLGGMEIMQEKEKLMGRVVSRESLVKMGEVIIKELLEEALEREKEKMILERNAVAQKAIAERDEAMRKAIVERAVAQKAIAEQAVAQKAIAERDEAMRKAIAERAVAQKAIAERDEAMRKAIAERDAVARKALAEREARQNAVNQIALQLLRSKCEPKFVEEVTGVSVSDQKELLDF